MRLLAYPRITRLTSKRFRRRLHSAASVLVAVSLTFSPLSGNVAFSNEPPATAAGTVAEATASPSSGSTDTSGQPSSGSTEGGTQTSTGSGQTQPSGGQTADTTSNSTDTAAPSSGSSAPPSSGDSSGGTQPATSQPATQSMKQPGQTAGAPLAAATPAGGSDSARQTAMPTTESSGGQSTNTGDRSTGGPTAVASTPVPTPGASSNGVPTDGQTPLASPQAMASPQPTVSSPSVEPTPAATPQSASGAVAQSGQTVSQTSTQGNTATGGGSSSPAHSTPGSGAVPDAQSIASETPVAGTPGPTPGTPDPGAGAQAAVSTPQPDGSTTPMPTVATPTPNPPVATPTPSSEPLVSARSGDAVAQTGQSQSAQLNVQVSTGATGGGSGSVAVQSQAVTTVDRTGQASAESGMAVALTPAPQPTDGVAVSGQTTDRTVATSGDAAATGLQSQNVVNNTAQASIQVQGPSSGDIKVESANRVVITEDAHASASTGNVLAAPGGTPSPAAAATPVPATAGLVGGATSMPVASTGLAVQNRVDLTMQVAATPWPSASGTITVQQAGGVTIENRGVAVAVSDEACAGANCPTPTRVEPLANSTPVPVPSASATVGATSSTGAVGTPGSHSDSGGVGSVGATTAGDAPTTPSKGDTRASSGSAQATGLEAQNVVNTDANVQVRVQGENRGLIHVLVESIVQIFNFGWAWARTGDAVAANGGASDLGASGGAAGTTTVASSGEVQATGAQVDNRVDVHSSASVRVAGDNYSPVNLFIELFARISNFAFGRAASGDARAAGGSGLSGQGANGSTASSGSAQATGLEAQNLVNMSAAATVDIEGSNYADVFVRVRFHTIIENEGGAHAVSGKAESIGDLGAPAAKGSSSGSDRSSGSASQGTGGTGHWSGVAKSGDAKAQGHNSSVQVASVQHASGNGSGPGLDVTLPSISNSLPDPPADVGTGGASLPDALQPLIDPVGDVHAESGSASSYGFQTGDAATNVQVGHAANPGSSEASATNSYEFDVEIRGDSDARTGFAGVNATPTPMPRPDQEEPRSGGNGGSESQQSEGAGGSERESGYHEVNARLVSHQSWVSGNRQSGDEGMFRSRVNVSVPSRWPEFEQPLMPGQRLLRAGVSPARSGAVGTGFSGDAQGRSAGTWMDVDPMGAWPAFELPPMPGQVVERLAGDPGAGEEPGAGFPGGGSQTPISALLWGLAGMLALAAVVTTKRGRAWMASWAHSWLRQAQAATRLFLSLLQH